MKFTTLLLAAVSAIAASAAAVADLADKREADPWCLFHGQGCWKRDVAAPAAVSVREASPAAEAEADPWCLFHGQGCWKRDAEPEAVADPEAWCLFHGQGCWKEKREALALPAPAADPEADPWCLFHGQGCWKDKREAAPAPKADPEAWCLFHGQGCWKVKRAVYAFANAVRSVGSVKDSRSADISNARGGAAYNAKRAVEDIATMIAGRQYGPPEEFLKALALYQIFGPDSNYTGPTDSANATVKRDAEAEPWCLFHGQGCWKRSEDALQARDDTADATRRWCLFHGQGCWKRDAAPWCLFHGQGCWKRTDEGSTDALARRDAKPAFCPFEGSSTCYASKRDFVAADKRACNQPGQACDIARRAAEALISEIESFQPAKRSDDVEARWCLFHGQGCWKRDRMDQVVARCNAEDGACSQARRDLGAMHVAARNLLEYLNDE